MSTITIQAPSGPLVIAMMTSTTPVRMAPMPLMAAVSLHPGGRWRRQRRNIPVCDSVNDRNTPIM